MPLTLKDITPESPKPTTLPPLVVPSEPTPQPAPPAPPESTPQK